MVKCNMHRYSVTIPVKDRKKCLPSQASGAAHFETVNFTLKIKFWAEAPVCP